MNRLAAWKRFFPALLWIAVLPVQAGFHVAESSLFELDTGGRPPSISSSTTGDFVIDTGGRTPGLSVSSTANFIINTRGGAAASFNSAYFTIDTRGLERLSVRLKAMDGPGVNLAGVTVTAWQNGLDVARTTTTSDGSATLANLLAGYYELRAEKAGYQTQVRSPVRVPEDVLNGWTVRMPVPKQVPVLTESAVPPVPSVLVRQAPGAIGVLRVFEGGANGQFSNSGEIFPDRMTIVLTHGCISDSDTWPLAMARTLATARMPGLNNRPNIVAWDWRDAAGGVTQNSGLSLISSGFCVLPRQSTSKAGLELGQTLWSTLGNAYDKPVHFIGHSLGTLVNCAAVNYLHGDDWNHVLPGGSVGWNWKRTHVTLLDHAQLAPDLRLTWNPLEWVGWDSPIPKCAAYIENYLTMVGIYQDVGVNVFLQRSKGLLIGVHQYPQEWYRQSILQPGTSEVGFRYSFEYGGENVAFPTPPCCGGVSAPEQTLKRAGVVFAQDEGNSNERALIALNVPEGLAARIAIELVTHVPFGGLVLTYSLRATRYGVEATTFVVDEVSTVTGAVARKTGQVAVSMVERVYNNYGGSLNPMGDPVYGVGASTPAVVGIPGYSNETLAQPVLSLRLDMRTQPLPLFPGPRNGRPLPSADTPGNIPAYVWLPVHVPTNAVALVFDFSLNGNGASDRVVAGINASNIFSLAAEFIATNTMMSSGVLPVEAWAGQEVELFFGVADGTSTNALLSVEGIRFLNLPVPRLMIQLEDGNPVLSWTEAAPGFRLEIRTNLTDLTGWTVANNVGGYPGQRVYTNQTTATQEYYRLKRP